jgi:hypothetical protein
MIVTDLQARIVIALKAHECSVVLCSHLLNVLILLLKRLHLVLYACSCYEEAMHQLAGVTNPQGARIFKHYAAAAHSSSSSNSTAAAAATVGKLCTYTLLTHYQVCVLLLIQVIVC